MARTTLTAIIFLACIVLLATAHSRSNRRYTPRTTTIFHKLGDRTIPLVVMQYGDAKDLVMINMHDDESTSVEAAKQLLEENGGLLIRIENNDQRIIRFRLRGQYYRFDANRIFSREGIQQTLSELGNSNAAAIDETDLFAQRILQLLPKNPACIIALHNNTDGEFSVKSYMAGNPRAKDARKVHADPGKDSDDLFLTTDSLLFEKLSANGYNTIWQDNENARKDGSLSIYCAEKNLRYINCETQHGKTDVYFAMLNAAVNYIDREPGDHFVYNYRIPDAKDLSLVEGIDVFFGEKKIGRLLSADMNGGTGLSGKLSIDRKFPLYSNMDLFLLTSGEGASRIELRIDPTREKKLSKATTDIIPITVKAQP